MSTFLLLVLVLLFAAVLSIPCLLAYSAWMVGDSGTAAALLVVAAMLVASVAAAWNTGGEVALFNQKGESAQGVEVMKNYILKRKVDGALAMVTHWNHFHVNRFTGSTVGKAFTVLMLSGETEGNSYVWPCSMLHGTFEVVGKDEAVPVA